MGSPQPPTHTPTLAQPLPSPGRTGDKDAFLGSAFQTTLHRPPRPVRLPAWFGTPQPGGTRTALLTPEGPAPGPRDFSVSPKW